MSPAQQETLLRKTTSAAMNASLRQGVVLGRGWRSAFAPLLTQSKEVVEATYLYIKAARRLHRHNSAGSHQMFEQAADLLASRLGNLDGEYLVPIYRDIVSRRRAYLTLTREASLLPQSRMPQFVRAVPFQDRRMALRELAIAKAQKKFVGNIDKLHARLFDSRKILLRSAYDAIGKVIGPGFDEAWSPVFEYLAKNESRITSALSKLEAAISAGGSAAKEARSVAGYTSKIKGLLGEAYISKWQPWLDMKEGLKDLAQVRVEELNRAARKNGQDVFWKLVTVPPGRIRLDHQETWDEAFLIVEEARAGAPYRRAHVFSAAQIKVEKDLTGLAQSLKDERRESGLFSRSPSPSLPVLSIEHENRAIENLFVVPPDPNHRPIRWIFAPDGVNLPWEDIALLRESGLQVLTRTFDRTVEEFNALAYGLMESLLIKTP